MSKSTKMTLGKFLGDAADKNAYLPSGPDPNRDPNNNGRRNYTRDERDNRRNEGYGARYERNNRDMHLSNDRASNDGQWRRQQLPNENYERPGGFGNRYDSYGERRNGNFNRSQGNSESSFNNRYSGIQGPPQISERPPEMRLKLDPPTKKTEESPEADAKDSASISHSSTSKSNPFGGAKAVDTSRKEREIEEKMSSFKIQGNSFSSRTMDETNRNPRDSVTDTTQEEPGERSLGRWASLRSDNSRYRDGPSYNRDSGMGGSFRNSFSSFERRDSRGAPPSSNAFNSRFRNDLQRNDDRPYGRRESERFMDRRGMEPSSSYQSQQYTDQPSTADVDRQASPDSKPVESEPIVVEQRQESPEEVKPLDPIPTNMGSVQVISDNDVQTKVPEKTAKKPQKAQPPPKEKKVVRKDAADIIGSALADAEELLRSGKKGSELAESAVCNDINAGSLLLCILQHDEKPMVGKWASDNEYGLALKKLAPAGQHKKQMQLIYAVQMYANKEGFPKKTEKDNLFQNLITFLYSKDFCEEDAYELWKEDIADNTPGKVTALVQSVNFFEWLNAASESEGSADSD